MLRHVIVMSCVVALSGCAFHNQVERFGVEYNEALASMANEQALLNILRASKGMPTHFSSVSRFTGSLALKATASVNGQLKSSGSTLTNTTGTTLSNATTTGTSTAAGAITTTNSSVATPESANSLVNAVTTGGDQYTPQIGGELDSGTTFDVSVYDQQKFYEGITSSVLFSTVEMLLNQGYDPDLIANLLISRVDIYVAKDDRKDGDVVASYRNEAGDRARFQKLTDCNVLDVAEARTPDSSLAPISRLTSGKGQAQFTMEQLALLDGQKLGLSSSKGMTADGAADANLFIVRPGTTSRIPKLVSRSCAGMQKLPIPQDKQGEAIYLGDGYATVGEPVNGTMQAVKKKVVLEIVFRSPEAVLRAVGDMVRRQNTGRAATLAVCPNAVEQCVGTEKKHEPIFMVANKRDRSAPVSAHFLNVDYSIPESDFRSLQVLSIVEQLVNLQKEASESAVSIPVRAVP